MKNNKAFTLVEVLAVIIIIAVIMLIAVPAYSSYITSSKKSTYADNMRAYVESAKGLVYSRYFGVWPEDGELLVIPINKLELEKSDKLESPYGSYVSDKSYIVVLPRTTTGNTASTVYNYYVVAIDKQNVAINNVLNEHLAGKEVQVGYNAGNIASIVDLASRARSLTYNNKVYEFCENRSGGALLLCAESGTVNEDTMTETQYSEWYNTFTPTSEACFNFNTTSGIIVKYYAYENNNSSSVPCPKDVVIPSIINGKEVKELGNTSFQSMDLTSAVLPDTLKVISYHALNANKLTSIIIPNGVTSIYSHAFYYNLLTNVVIPHTVAFIGESAFNANLLPDNQAFIFKRNADGSADKTTVVSYGGQRGTNITIPEGVTTLNGDAFSGIYWDAPYERIKSIIFPVTLTTVASGAFRNSGVASCVILYDDTHSADRLDSQFLSVSSIGSKCTKQLKQ